jgi:hypothetical protein
MHIRWAMPFVCLYCLALCACSPVANPEVYPDKVLIFGTFSGTEDGVDVIRTPASEFGWFASDVKIGFISVGEQRLPWTKKKITKSGYFSTVLPAGQFSVNIQMPTRQVWLNHAFSAPEKGKAYYLGHINLEITPRFVFFIFGGCNYGSVDKFSVSDELDKSTRWLATDPQGKMYVEVVKSLLVPRAEGETPSVDYDCGFASR